ncbi:PTS sugar transporter subunit IIC [Lactococcus lactis]|nr:PTS sugar transporter subunit IIC [Lactococcus lactis]
MEYGVLSVILVIVVAFLAGLEGILDQWQFHQPIIACSLIGIVTGHASAGIILGGSLQLIALGWANVGAAVAPDAALASIASSILMVQSNNFDLTHIMGTIVPAAILLATAGLVLTTLVRMLSVVLVHQADRAAEKGSYSGVEMWHFIALICQGLRIAIPAGLLLVISPDAIQKHLLLFLQLSLAVLLSVVGWLLPLVMQWLSTLWLLVKYGHSSSLVSLSHQSLN